MRKQINGYDNYFIYNNGDVLNVTTNKILKGSISEHGYKYYRLSKNNQKKMYYAHRLVAEYFLDNPNNLPVVNHKDGNKLHNNIDNLEWVSYTENIQHAHNNGLIKERRKSEYYKEDLKNEVWKKIENTHYSISSQGRVRNDNTNLLLKGSITCGYLKVRLSNDGQVKDILIHHLVYLTFNNMDKIPEGYTIDHINANKIDNRLENLQLITLNENVKNALYKTGTNKTTKPVIQMTLTDEYLQEFPSAAETARQLGLDSSTVSKVCRGVIKSHGGFHFKYK